MIRLLLIVGARPNFVKIAPIVWELRCRREAGFYLVHTGQHFDHAMSGQFFDELGIPMPDVNLEVGAGSHAVQTAEILKRLEPVIVRETPDIVLVVGDVNSTLAAALVASKLSVPVAHVEAGLRSFDRSMPEEINRILTDALSRWCFVSERAGIRNLQHEGIGKDRVFFVGNIMIDTLMSMSSARKRSSILEDLSLRSGEYAVLTLHRPANVESPAYLSRLLQSIGQIHQEMPVVFPVHPRTLRSSAIQSAQLPPSLRLLGPMGYLAFTRLIECARLVLTDSGGIQEETTALGVPCLTLRNTTERPVTVTEGTNRLVRTDPDAVAAAVREILASPPPNARLPELWDGHAAKRTLDVLLMKPEPAHPLSLATAARN